MVSDTQDIFVTMTLFPEEWKSQTIGDSVLMASVNV